jgi:hypothetical protein
VRRTLKPIKNRCAESLRGNSFRNDKIETKCIEFAQISKQVRSRFAKVLLFAEISDCEKLQGVAVSSPPLGDLEIALPWMPRQQTNALFVFR